MSTRKLLDPSELGTKEYWEAAYTRELTNNQDNASDEGVIWFDESDAEANVLRKLNEFATKRGLLQKQSCRFLDLGTGNGHMLLALREDEIDDDDNDDDDDPQDERFEAANERHSQSDRWLGDMVGVDYSPQSVALAKQLDQRRLDVLQEESPQPLACLHFAQWDILTAPLEAWLPVSMTNGDGLREDVNFDVVLDKGTFDAISLMPIGTQFQQQHPCDIYREKVTALIKPGGFLFITSCNWTKDELVDWLRGRGDHGLHFFDEVAYPTFTFGGKTGQSIVTIVFKRAG